MLMCLKSRTIALISLSALAWSGLLMGVQQSLAAEPPLNILVINSYDQDIPWQRSFERGFKTVLGQEQRDVQIFMEYLNSGKIPDHDYLNTVGPHLESKYRSVLIDVLITESEPAYQSIYNNPNLFPNSKKLFVQPGEKVNFPDAPKGASITFLDNFEAAISEMQRLADPEKVYVIADASTPPRKKRLDAFKAALNRGQSLFETEYLIDLPMADLIEKVASLPDNSAIFYLLIFRDGAGENFSPYQAAQLITERANAPMFSNWESLTGSGIVGGYLLSGELVGESTARSALTLALGRTTDNQDETGYGYYYDWRQLQRWNIDESRLPNNANILFYQPTLIQQYSWQIIATLLALAGLFLFSTTLFVSSLKRKKAEQAFKDSEERYHNLLEQQNDLISYFDQSGRRTYVNAAFCHFTGQSMEELLSKQAGSHLPTTQAQEIHETTLALTPKNPITEHEYEMSRHDGDHRWILWADHGLFNDAGELVGVQAVGRDITERKRAEEELIHHRDHLEELVAERTAEIKKKTAELEWALESEKKYSALQKQFVSLVSHEFRTPLTIIDGNARRLIKRKNESSPEQLEGWGKVIRRAVKRMVSLVDSTLYSSRLDADKIEIKCEPCDLAALLDEICDRQTEISPFHDIRLDLDGLSDAISADTKLLEHVFTNLLSNAVKFAPDSPLIEVRGRSENDWASISVKDYGIGIDEKDLPNIFERYFRAKTADGFQGTGIGLNVSKEFVEMHRGTITIDSVEGEGSTFTVRLPINGDRQ